ncbi:sugar phosphate isomerase/epimerase [Paenibacillus sp. J5C_2022]|uniref:sugar phosphate isomerase/epimerase n=1 Tax=Paenibacillus sp. J5C2022 TaxID=2977129 RepID=UPI0021D0A50C|nr:sugar phosphate isomerase/epimerase [Paenibacillus sp. J5C2022]MCU6712032.1 sugar phosphate isomerase/epimerase [Paenibacillus sp. J5C2022]
MPPTVNVYCVEPERHPEFHRRFARAITRGDLGNQIQFSSLRAMDIDNKSGEIKDFNKELDLYTKHYKIGNILWLFYKFLYAPNFKAFVDEVKARGLYIFDIWGYVPGSMLDRSSWGEYEVPEEAAAYLRETLGNHFLGFDNGEQDGRYIGGYTSMISPVQGDRRSHYAHFQRHFEQLGNHFDNQLVAVCSMHFCHYFAKEGNTIMIGAETAQALPNANVWYAYLRGAGKQYGLLWFANASIWNRFGYKDFEREGFENGYEFGPESGSSLSLLRRLIYVEYMYNCDILGLEWGFTMPDELDPPGTKLTPVGQIHAEAAEYVRANGSPGSMYTPVAILMDFHNGWTPPRHLYAHEYYKVWGTLPYEAGDYQVHALFSMLYPEYENAGFYRDERGFLTATPHGELADVLFSDVEAPVLGSYRTVIVAGKLVLDAELIDKLAGFAAAGGHVILCAAALADASPTADYEAKALALCGIDSLGELRRSGENSEIVLQGRAIAERSFDYYSVVCAPGAEAVARVADSGLPLIVQSSYGLGQVSFITSPYGLNAEKLVPYTLEEREARCLMGPDIVTMRTIGAADNIEEQDIPRFYHYLSAVAQHIAAAIERERIVEVDNASLQYIVNGRADGSLLVAVVNHTAAVQRFSFRTKRAFKLAEELALPQLPDTLPGYYAQQFGNRDREVEGSGDQLIHPADIRLFKFVTEQGGAKTHTLAFAPEPTAGHFLAVRQPESFKAELLARPTFSHHFQGAKLDAAYFLERDITWLRTEAAYVRRRKADVIVDFTSLLNHYPQFSLLDNLKDRYADNMARIAAVLEKAALYGCKHALFILHRNAENHIMEEQAIAAMGATLRHIASMAEQHGITIYLQNGTKGRLLKSTAETAAFISSLGIPNLKLAYNIAHSLSIGESIPEVWKQYREQINGLLLSAPGRDDYCQFYHQYGRIGTSAFAAEIQAFVAATAGRSFDFICQDATYSNWDEAYADRRLLAAALAEAAIAGTGAAAGADFAAEG